MNALLKMADSTPEELVAKLYEEGMSDDEVKFQLADFGLSGREIHHLVKKAKKLSGEPSTSQSTTEQKELEEVLPKTPLPVTKDASPGAAKEEKVTEQTSKEEKKKGGFLSFLHKEKKEGEEKPKPHHFHGKLIEEPVATERPKAPEDILLKKPDEKTSSDELSENDDFDFSLDNLSDPFSEVKADETVESDTDKGEAEMPPLLSEPKDEPKDKKDTEPEKSIPEEKGEVPDIDKKKEENIKKEQKKKKEGHFGFLHKENKSKEKPEKDEPKDKKAKEKKKKDGAVDESVKKRLALIKQQISSQPESDLGVEKEDSKEETKEEPISRSTTGELSPEEEEKLDKETADRLTEGMDKMESQMADVKQLLDTLRDLNIKLIEILEKK